MSLHITPSDDGELYELRAYEKITLPELHVGLNRTLAEGARHILIDLRYAWFVADPVEITMFTNFLHGTLLPNLDECDGRSVVLMQTADNNQEPQSNSRVFRDLKRTERKYDRFDIVEDLESALQLFTKQVTPRSDRDFNRQAVAA